MSRVSAGLLLYRKRAGRLQVLLVHPGGPFFRNQDAGAWTIPKGLANPDEDLLASAKREFEEETGFKPSGEFITLAPIKQKSGKVVHAWAVEGNIDPAKIRCNMFEMEWPPKSGKRAQFPEVDRAEFFDLETARSRINPAQAALLDQLAQAIS